MLSSVSTWQMTMHVNAKKDGKEETVTRVSMIVQDNAEMVELV